MKGAIPKMVCHSIAGWSHPRAPSVLSLACAKDSHIWSVQHHTLLRCNCCCCAKVQLCLHFNKQALLVPLLSLLSCTPCSTFF